MFSLTRLILIDSYKANAWQELRLNGHTNLNGVNGAGKTTLLRLLPLFFGESPRRLVAKSRVSDSFAKHYLPNDSSYIIFEYRRNQQMCMVVIYAAQNEESLYYRFVNKAFAIEDFTETHTDGAFIPISCRYLKKHLTLKRIQYSDQLSCSDYRRVIQNLSSKEVTLRRFATQYSFVNGAGGQRLKDMEKIVSGMLMRFTEFDDLREMLVSCIDEERKEISLNVTTDNTLLAWHKEYRAFEKVEAERPQAMQLTHTADELAQTANNLAELQQRLQLFLQQTEQQAREYQQKLNVAGEQNGLLKKNWYAQELAIKSALATINAELEQCRRDKTKLEKEKASWQQQNIDGQRLLASRLTDIKNQLNSEKANYQQFSAAIQDINAEFKRREADLARQFGSQQHDYEKRIAELKFQALLTKNEANEAYQKQKTSLEKTTQSQQADIQNRIMALSQQLGGIISQLKAVTADPQLLRDKEQKQAQLHQLSQDKQAADQQAREFEKKKHATQTDIERILKDKQQRADQKQTIQQQHTLLKQQLHAAPDSLLGFLREQQPHWVEDIAKVIHPDLLLREDLDPSLTTEQASLYGLQLNLTLLTADYTADEVQIRQRMTACDNQLDALQNLDQKSDVELENLHKIRTALHKQQQQAEATATNYQNQFNKGNQELSSLTQQIERSKKQRRQQFEQQLQEVNTQIVQQKQQFQEAQTQLNTQLSNLQTQLTMEQQQIDAHSQQQQQAIQQQINQLQQQQQQDLATLEQQRLRSLQERKVDTATLLDLEKNIARLKNEQQQAEKAVAVVESHQRWLANQWVCYEDLLVSIRNGETALQQQSQQYDSAKQRFEHEQKQLETQRSDAELALQNCQKQLGNIKDLLAKLSKYPLSNNTEARLESAHTLLFLRNNYRELTEQYENQRAELSKLVRHLKRVLAQELGTRPAQYYATQENLLGFQAEDKEWISAIQNWYEEDLATYQRLLISQARNFGSEIYDYKQKLESFNRGIDKLSRRLTANIDKNIRFEKIEQIEARLKSKVAELDYWKQLEKFSELYNEWQRTDNSLPSPEFAKVIEQVAQQLPSKGRLETKLVNLLELEILVTENGRHKRATQSEELRRISSEGLSYLILCVIFIALVNMIRKEQQITIIWPMDELKDLHDCNIELLLELLAKNNIHVLSAFPSADPNLLALFTNAYELGNNREIIEFVS